MRTFWNCLIVVVGIALIGAYTATAITDLQNHGPRPIRICRIEPAETLLGRCIAADGCAVSAVQLARHTDFIETRIEVCGL